MSSTNNPISRATSSSQAARAQAVQSAISTHQQQSGWIESCPRPGAVTESWTGLQAAMDAYLSGRISGAEYGAMQRRSMAFLDERAKRVADFDARKQAGETKPNDFAKEFYGYTEDEAEELHRQGCQVELMRIANAERSRSHMAQNSRYGRGH